MEKLDFIKSKPTKYNNYDFRSRLEAKWAVFFDTLKIKYHYEYMDFVLENGKRYLPDFYLPVLDAFAEIKHEFTDEEKNKCYLLCKLTGKNVLMLNGEPDIKHYYYYVNFDGIIEDFDFLFYPEDDRLFVCTGLTNKEIDPLVWKFCIGVYAARNYKFEFNNL